MAQVAVPLHSVTSCNENNLAVVVVQLAMNTNIMKKTILFTSLVLLLFAACRKANNPTVYDLGVDLQNSFDKDNVQVVIDNQPLLNAQVTTNDLLSLAKSISTVNTEGKHTIKVVINDTLVKTESFTQSGELYVGITYNRTTSDISFKFSPHRFVYD
jgi:hypothetical protein